MAKRDATRFAAAERAPRTELQRQAGYFAGHGFTRQLLDALPDILAILNQQRQIIFANRALLELIGAKEEVLVHGLRPGEALDCLHAGTAAGGCGTGEPCSTCGAVLAILAGLDGRRSVQECRITRCIEGRQEAMDLRIFATPLRHGGENLTVFAASDISHEKRRNALERIFFHDILNVVGSIKGFAELLTTYPIADQQDVFRHIHEAAQQTIEEIEAQRTLAVAESRELKVHPERFDLVAFLAGLLERYRPHEVARDRHLRLVGADGDLPVHTDRALLGRVVGNMIKNALEATPAGGTVRLEVRPEEGAREIAVHNPGAMPREAQLQIFQRSFSTKGRGRGLGTYSMKLLSGYLDAELSFSSSEQEGTTFRLRLPTEAP